MHKFNRADKTLLVAACLFLVALPIRIKYPGIFTEAFLFCIEAALVGGIADWFAVSALFRKPLGIPWHTAILPKRRQAFTEATIRLVQRQFFAKKIVFQRVKSLNASEKVICWLDNDTRKQLFTEKVTSMLLTKIAQIDSTVIAEKLSVYLNENVIKTLDMKKWCAEYLETDKWKTALVKNLAIFIKGRISGETGVEDIKKLLEHFESEKIKQGASSLLMSLGGFFDVINNEECALLIQKKLLILTDQLFDSQSQVHKDMAAIVDKAIKETIAENNWQELIDLLQKKLLDSGMLKKIILGYLSSIKKQCDNSAQDSELRQVLKNFIAVEIEDCFSIMRNNKEIYKLIETLINDILRRSALQAQSMVGDIVRRALNNMSDEQLNTIVHSKINTDLIWIRMNGSIVGGGIGILLFIFMRVIR